MSYRVVEMSIAGDVWRFDPGQFRSLAIPLCFDGEQPNAFGLPRASVETFSAGPFVGDVQRGGSVNCSTVTLNPHGNGTHTECMGHITFERLYIHECLREALVPSTLVTVPLCRKADSSESYVDVALPDDLMITKAALEQACEGLSDEWLAGLIIRTLPNDPNKVNRCHSGQSPPYFSLEAAHYIRSRGVRHLLVDLPSVDREEDGGKLAVHHIFWSLEGNGQPLEKEARSRTITEMIFVPDDILDGPFILTLQVPPFLLDAAPSRPIIYAAFSSQSSSPEN